MATLDTGFPFTIKPINNITPFTYRDGMTYLELLYKLRDYMVQQIVPEFNDEMARIIDEFNAGIANAEQHITATEQSWNERWDTFMANIEAEIAALNDAGVASLVEDKTSQLWAILEAVFPQKAFMPINVRDHGAVGDGVTDDSEAIRSAIIESVTAYPDDVELQRAVYFPAGDYYIAQNKIFSNFDWMALTLPDGSGINGNWHKGLLVYGDGKRSTRLTLEATNSEAWYYDNESVDNRVWARLNFAHMNFETTNVEMGNGFKQWSNGGEKRFHFTDCCFELGTIFQTEGSGNADLNKFTRCWIITWRAMFVFNNNFTVACELTNTDAWIYRDFVVLGKNGGGGKLHVNGGSWIMREYTIPGTLDYETTPRYLVSAPQEAQNSFGNGDFNFTDLALEMRPNKGLVNAKVGQDAMIFRFTRCNFQSTDGFTVAADTVDINDNKRVQFRDTVLRDSMTFKAESSWTGAPFGAVIDFHDCSETNTGGPLLSERVQAIGNGSRIVSNGLIVQSGGSSTAIRAALDFDHGWQNGRQHTITANVKMSPIITGFQPLPYGDNSNARDGLIDIPSGAFIKAIHFEKDVITGTGATSPYRVFIGSDDKSTVLGSSASGSVYGDKLTINETNIGRIGFTRIRLWATGTMAGGTIDPPRVSYIEYV